MSGTPSVGFARARVSLPRFRRAMVLAHRWMGLAMGAFLVVVGATGSLIAFNDELEAAISPQLFRVVPPHPGAPFLDPFEIRDRVLATHPWTEVNWVELAFEPGRSVVVGLDAAPGAPGPLANDQVFVDPYTGCLLGERLQADLSQGPKNLMPFVYRLHTSLALGDGGTLAPGVAALLWTIDCFVGFYLTLPLGRAAAPSRRSWRDWPARWAPAWRVRWRAAAAKSLFDLHRAGGLWTWALLFVLAWSGVGFNLPAVYQPVMSALGGYAVPGPVAAADRPPVGAAIGWARAHRMAQEAMAREAVRNGFTVRRERLLHLDAARGRYEYRVLSTLDVGERLGNTTLFLDADTGALLHLDLPTGRHSGNTVDAWLSSVHTAAWGGRVMQIVLCATGAVVVMLSATGVWLWWRRRRGRRAVAVVGWR